MSRKYMTVLQYAFCNKALDDNNAIRPWYREKNMSRDETVVVFTNMYMSRLLTLASVKHHVTLGSRAMMSIDSVICKMESEGVDRYGLLSRRLIEITRLTLGADVTSPDATAEVLYRRVCLSCFLIGLGNAFQVTVKNTKLPPTNGFLYFEKDQLMDTYRMFFLQTNGICGSMDAAVFVRLVRHLIGGRELFREYHIGREWFLSAVAKHMPEALLPTTAWIWSIGRHLHEAPCKLDTSSTKHRLRPDSEECKFIWEIVSLTENRQWPLFIKSNSIAHIAKYTSRGWGSDPSVNYVTLERGYVSTPIEKHVYCLLRHVLECIPCDNATRVLSEDVSASCSKRRASLIRNGYPVKTDTNIDGDGGVGVGGTEATGGGRKVASTRRRVMRFNKKGCVSVNQQNRATCRRNMYRVLKSVVETASDYSVHMTSSDGGTLNGTVCCGICRSLYGGNNNCRSNKRCIVIASEYISLAVESFNAMARHYGVKACMRLTPEPLSSSTRGECLSSLASYADYLTDMHRRSGLTSSLSSSSSLPPYDTDGTSPFQIGLVSGIVGCSVDVPMGTFNMNAVNKNIVNNCDFFDERSVAMHIEGYQQEKETSFVQNKFTQKDYSDNATTVSRYTNSRSMFSVRNENVAGGKCKQVACRSSFLYWSQRQMGRRSHMLLVGRPRQSNYCSTIDVNGVENQSDVTQSLISRSLPNFPGSKRHNLVEKSDKSTVYLKNTLANQSITRRNIISRDHSENDGQTSNNFVIVSPVYSRSCINIPKICGSSLVTVMQQEISDLTDVNSVVEIDYMKNELLCRQERRSRSLLTQLFRLSVEMMADMDVDATQIKRYSSSRLCLSHARSFAYGGVCKLPRGKAVTAFFYPTNVKLETSGDLLSALHVKHNFDLGAYQKHFRDPERRASLSRLTKNNGGRSKRKNAKRNLNTIPYEPPKRSSNFITCCATMSHCGRDVSLLNYLERLMKRKEKAGMKRTASMLDTITSISREFLFKRNKKSKIYPTFTSEIEKRELPLPRGFT